MTVTYLEDDCLRLGDEGGSLELSASYDLRFHDALLLPHHRLGHVLFLQSRELRLIVTVSDLLDDVILPVLLVLSQFELELVGVLQGVHVVIFVLICLMLSEIIQICKIRN